MLSDTLASTLQQRGVHYGWVVAAVTFLTLLVSAGALGAPGVLIGPLEKEFGWSNAAISATLALRLVLFGLMAPFAAAFINRFGLRPVIVTALGLIVSGFLGSLLMTELWHLLILWGVIVGFGTGLIALVLAAVVATRWFTHRRGLVVGLLSASSATGQLIFLPAMAALSERYGWHSVVAFVVVLLSLAAVAVLLLMRDRPADLGLPPYGETAVLPAPAPMSLGGYFLQPITVLGEAVRVPLFWVLFGTFYICGASTNGLIQVHFVSLCGDYGIAAVGAASVLALMGLFDLAGTIGSGWLSDRYDNRWLLAWYYGLRGLSLIFLPFSDFGVYGLTIFAVFYGLDWLATVPPTVKLAADRFGREKAGMVFGWVFTGHQLGAASAAFGAGWTRTTFDTYLPAFFVAGMLCLVAAAAVFLIEKPKRPPLP